MPVNILNNWSVAAISQNVYGFTALTALTMSANIPNAYTELPITSAPIGLLSLGAVRAGAYITLLLRPTPPNS